MWIVILLAALTIVFVLRVRARLAVLAEQIRQLRHNASEPINYSRAPVGELDKTLGPLTNEVEKLGFRVLGDYVENSTLDKGTRRMRWIVDGASTTFGWLAPFEVDRQRHLVAVLMSHELDQQTITARQPASSMLSRPPFVDIVTVAVATSMTETYARHRKRARLDDPERAFVPVKTFEEVEHELARMRDKVTAWRRSQPADELLEADLKSLLGSQYAKLAGPLRRRLAPR
jgi:hypothetical protein